MVSVGKHYDLLIENNNDPLNDSEELKQYMDKWDGKVFLNELNLNREKICLEIGCGTGRMLAKIFDNYKNYVGIDVSSETIIKAKQHFKADNISFIHDDFLKHKFYKKFDIVYSTLTFMHIRRKKKCIKKVYNLLENNGRFVLSIDKSQNKILDTGYSKIKIYPDNKDEIQNMLQSIGFKENKCLETELAFIFTSNK